MSTSEQVQAERAFGVELVQYAGRWVAVQDRTVLADDETLGALLDQLNGQRETAEIFKVREDPAAPCS
jgi:hypothetical protein